jgi:hypothetical protein
LTVSSWCRSAFSIYPISLNTKCVGPVGLDLKFVLPQESPLELRLELWRTKYSNVQRYGYCLLYFLFIETDSGTISGRRVLASLWNLVSLFRPFASLLWFNPPNTCQS